MAGHRDAPAGNGQDVEPRDGVTQRIQGARVDIDYTATLEFFEGRASRAAQPDALTTVLYQDGRPEVAAARHRFEVDRILPLLALGARPRVLDVGCGNGRWARTLSGRVDEYLGIDFSSGLVAQAQRAQPADDEGFVFQELSAVAIGDAALALPPPFGLVIVAGVLIYLNDDDVARVIAAIAELMAPSAVVYVREPVAVDTRLTLDRFPSVELGSLYTAVYRPAEHYRDLLASALGGRGFRFELDAPISADLRNRAETTQHYFVLRRP